MSLSADVTPTDADTLETIGGEAVILGLGGALLVLQVAYIRTSGDPFWHLVFEFLLPMLVTLGLLGGGVWLLTTDFEGEHHLRIAFWCLAGLNVMLVSNAFTLLSLRGDGVLLHHPLLITFDYVTGGAAAGFVLGIYDSNRRVKAAQLARTNERMTWLNQQLSVLNRVLRHDIRNDANVVLGYAERIEDEHPDAAEHTDVIRERATNLVRLGDKARNIEHLLNRDAWERETIDVVPIIEREVAQLDQDNPKLNVALDLPDSRDVLALPLISTAIEEALENAVVHNDAPTPRIEVGVATQERDDTEWTVVRIADNGPGFPDQELDVLEQESETELHHASGLGLWLIAWATRASDGDVTFERNDPRGSVVTLRLESAS